MIEERGAEAGLRRVVSMEYRGVMWPTNPEGVLTPY